MSYLGHAALWACSIVVGLFALGALVGALLAALVMADDVPDWLAGMWRSLQNKTAVARMERDAKHPMGPW